MMEDFHDKILYKTHQHVIVLIKKIIFRFFSFALPLSIIIYFLFSSYAWGIFAFLFLNLAVFGINYFFWSKSYFIISNYKLSIKVRNGLFSKYHMSIYFSNIKDIAYSKNNFLHYLFNYGSFFARSSAGAQGDFMVTQVPDVEKIYKYVNYIFVMPESERKNITNLDEIDNSYNESKKFTRNQIVQKEIDNLLKIKGITHAFEITDEDKKYIFQTEEDRNHGVYETIKKSVVICAVHDSDFRDPDSVIVLHEGKKVIFPGVSFHEVKQKNVVSSSPGLEVHNYLSSKIPNLSQMDATLLIGFDI